MKRIPTRVWLLAVAAMAVATALFGLLPFFVSTEGVREQILAQAKAITGREMTFQAAPRVTFRPFLGIEISNVVFRDSNAGELDPPLLQMEKLRGKLRVLPALIGRAEITRYQFVRPQFNFRVYGDGSASWDFPEGEIRSVLQKARSLREATAGASKPDFAAIEPVDLGIFEIIDGTLFYENRRTGRRETFTSINGEMSWPDTKAAWGLSGNCVWRGEAFEFSAASNAPLMLLSGGTAPVEIELKSGPFDFSFEGEGNFIADLHLAGPAKLSAGSVRRLASLFGATLPPGGTLSDFSVTGNLDATPLKAGFTQADVNLDGNVGRGALQIAFSGDGAAKIDGTMAANALDLTPYVSALQQAGEDGRDSAATMAPLLDFELDLRLSAGTTRIGLLDLKDLAATLAVHKGDALLDLGNATLLGGTLMGSAQLSNRGPQWVLSANVIANGLDAAATRSLFPASVFSATGTADLEASITADAAALGQIAGNAKIEITANVENGVLNGMNLLAMQEQALTASDATAVPPMEGQTAFRTIDAEIRIEDEKADIRRFKIDNSKAEGDASGQIDLAGGGLAIRLTISPGKAASANAVLAGPLRFFVGGSLEMPLPTLEKGETAQ